jgi:OOP family OmpA-OmpF porin
MLSKHTRIASLLAGLLISALAHADNDGPARVTPVDNSGIAIHTTILPAPSSAQPGNAGPAVSTAGLASGTTGTGTGAISASPPPASALPARSWWAAKCRTKRPRRRY